MKSSIGNIFRVTGNRWIPLKKASDAKLWHLLWSAPWLNGWVNNHESGKLKLHRAHYDVIVMNRHYYKYVTYSSSKHYNQVKMFFLWTNLPLLSINICLAEGGFVVFAIINNIHENPPYGFSQWEGALLCNANSHRPSPEPIPRMIPVNL